MRRWWQSHDPAAFVANYPQAPAPWPNAASRTTPQLLIYRCASGVGERAPSTGCYTTFGIAHMIHYSATPLHKPTSVVPSIARWYFAITIAITWAPLLFVGILAGSWPKAFCGYYNNSYQCIEDVGLLWIAHDIAWGALIVGIAVGRLVAARWPSRDSLHTCRRVLTIVGFGLAILAFAVSNTW
jgi:hypothetical protein